MIEKHLEKENSLNICMQCHNLKPNVVAVLLEATLKLSVKQTLILMQLPKYREGIRSRTCVCHKVYRYRQASRFSWQGYFRESLFDLVDCEGRSALHYARICDPKILDMLENAEARVKAREDELDKMRYNAQQIKCKACLKYVRRDKMKKHIDSICTKCFVDCPGCRLKCPRMSYSLISNTHA